ncbi:hypothetical protein DL96DRAFT_368889 [Flagelloscypha sp. PMI_526]|nr:hypothetical protein DL96DRAFT_368889 [Flagelloscypha sp. PMI_526]
MTEKTKMTFTDHCDQELWLQFQEALLNHSSETFLAKEEHRDADLPADKDGLLQNDDMRPLGSDAAPIQDNTLTSPLSNEGHLLNHDMASLMDDSSTSVPDHSLSGEAPLPLDDMIPLPEDFLQNNSLFSSAGDTSSPRNDTAVQDGDTTLAGSETISSQDEDTAPIQNSEISSLPVGDLMDTDDDDDDRSPTPNIETTPTSPLNNGILPPADEYLDSSCISDTSGLKRRRQNSLPAESCPSSPNDSSAHKRQRMEPNTSNDVAPDSSAIDSSMAIDAPSHCLPTVPPESDVPMIDSTVDPERLDESFPGTNPLSKDSEIVANETHKTGDGDVSVKRLSNSCPKDVKKKWFKDSWTLATPEGLEEPLYAVCLRTWYQLESCHGFQDNFKGFLKPELCPDEIRVWMKKKSAPDFAERDGQDFGRRLCIWWNANQPDSRTVHGPWHVVPLDDDRAIADLLGPDDDKWGHFQVPGRNGFFLMLIGMSWWWLTAHKSEDELVLWRRLVEDVSFMMSLIERIRLDS